MKVNRLTIAHISDIHRSRDNPISNVALLNSLIQDIDSYAKQGVEKPDILIVSGDIVQGHANTDLHVNQYNEALDFLNSLSSELFNGDKNRIILVPGNHDISWERSKASMEKINEEEVISRNGDLNQEILNQALKTSSNIKWSFRDRSFYRITNESIYNDRLKLYCEFYNKFYDDTRKYSIDPNEQFDIFDFPEIGISLVGFNSCFHNDHLNKAGSINPNCIAKVGLQLRDLNRQGRLIFATWHHSTKGAPYDQDYMDDTFIKNLISYNIHIGFHGHQHRQEILRAENNIIESKMMLILSAGSLCAEPSELPTGYNQQYNLLELLRINDKEIQINFYSRVKTPESSFDNPIWDKGVFNSNSTKFTTKIYHTKTNIPNIAKAEKLVGENKYKDAQDILEKYDLNDPFVRVFLLECYSQLENYIAIINKFSDPQNDNECISLLNACIEINDKETIKKVLLIEYVANSNSHPVIHLRNQLKGKVK